MAKQLTAQPTLRTYLDQIRLLSADPITNIVIAQEIGIGNTYLSRLLKREQDGEDIPPHIIARLESKYKHLLAPIKRKEEDGAVVSKLVEELFKLRSGYGFLLAVVKDRLTPEEWTAAEATLAQDAAQQMVQWKETGTF